MTLDHPRLRRRDSYWPEPRALPAEVLDGLARRLGETHVPVAKLPEIMELRAIGRSLLAYIRYLQGVRQTS